MPVRTEPSSNALGAGREVRPDCCDAKSRQLMMILVPPPTGTSGYSAALIRPPRPTAM
jgi:hypothetical protein